MTTKKYFKHFGRNICAALKAVLHCIFHVFHAILPISFTDHNEYHLKLHGDNEKHVD